jgi:protein-tyrosine phosphatase
MHKPTPKTSASHPIEVDFLPAHLVPGATGRIGMTLAPGKKTFGLNGPWNRDLDADLARLVDPFRISLLVCLIEDWELESFQMKPLFSKARALGMETEHLPIRDGGVPKDGDAIRALVSRILDATRAGKNVLVHCRGGVGRTGVVVASCLIELGHDPSEAISLVRAARKDTVEPGRQERWLAEHAKALGMAKPV